jgi:hypothetical protein
MYSRFREIPKAGIVMVFNPFLQHSPQFSAQELILPRSKINLQK